MHDQNNRINNRKGCFIWKSISLNNIFSNEILTFESQKFFHWNASWKLWEKILLEFIVKIHYEINVKLVFHEIPWRKNLTLYLSLKPNEYDISTWENITKVFESCQFKQGYTAKLFFQSFSSNTVFRAFYET